VKVIENGTIRKPDLGLI